MNAEKSGAYVVREHCLAWTDDGFTKTAHCNHKALFDVLRKRYAAVAPDALPPMADNDIIHFYVPAGIARAAFGEAVLYEECRPEIEVERLRQTIHDTECGYASHVNQSLDDDSDPDPCGQKAERIATVYARLTSSEKARPKE